MSENPFNESESKQAGVRVDNLTADHEDLTTNHGDLTADHGDLTADHGDKHVSEKSDLIDVSFIHFLYQAQLIGCPDICQMISLCN